MAALKNFFNAAFLRFEHLCGQADAGIPARPQACEALGPGACVRNGFAACVSRRKIMFSLFDLQVQNALFGFSFFLSLKTMKIKQIVRGIIIPVIKMLKNTVFFS